MRKTAKIQKKIGETPLETLENWRRINPQYAEVPIAYAGRLDPMASGTLLLILGDECKKLASYTKLDKEYVVELLLGVTSDTGDILGIVSSDTDIQSRSRKDIERILKNEIGTQKVPYPIFSSKTVSGKPLFLYALEEALDSIVIPTHDETIYDIRLVSLKNINSAELENRVTMLLQLAPTSDEPSKKLGADFRIVPVRESWKVVFEKEQTYQVVRLRVRCASGTYMRSLADRVGKKLETGGLALSIHRKKLGVHSFLGVI